MATKVKFQGILPARFAKGKKNKSDTWRCGVADCLAIIATIASSKDGLVLELPPNFMLREWGGYGVTERSGNRSPTSKDSKDRLNKQLGRWKQRQADIEAGKTQRYGFESPNDVCIIPFDIKEEKERREHPTIYLASHNLPIIVACPHCKTRSKIIQVTAQ